MAIACVAAAVLLASALAAPGFRKPRELQPIIIIIIIIITYEEAMARPQRENWIEAIREECNSILWNDPFAATATSMPTGNRPIGSKWVFKTKTNPDRSIWHTLPYNSGRAFGSGKYWCLRLH